MSQSGRLSAWETEASASGLNYEEAFHANCDSLGIGPGGTNERMVLYLQDITSSAETSLPGLQAICASQLSKTRWDEVGSDIADLHYTLGANLVVNGDFAVTGSWTGVSPATNWLVAGNGLALVLVGPGTDEAISQAITTIDATEYRVEFEITNAADVGVKIDFGGVNVIPAKTAAGVYAGFITVSGISNTIEIINLSGGTVAVDNVKVQQVTR